MSKMLPYYVNRTVTLYDVVKFSNLVLFRGYSVRLCVYIVMDNQRSVHFNIRAKESIGY